MRTHVKVLSGKGYAAYQQKVKGVRTVTVTYKGVELMCNKKG